MSKAHNWQRDNSIRQKYENNLSDWWFERKEQKKKYRNEDFVK